EIIDMSLAICKEAMNLDQAYKNYSEILIQRRPYQLSQEAEKVLGAVSADFDGPSELYEITKKKDIQFPNFKVDNKEYPLSYVSFEGNWESEVNTSKRHAAFNTFSETLRKYQHTTAKTYDMHLKQEKT